MTKKIERVTLERIGEDAPNNAPVRYFLSCGDVVSWNDKYPPTFCPFCGRMIDYAGPEGAEDE